MAAHLQRHHRQGQQGADPEPAREVGEFRVGSRLGARQLGLQRHATDRAAPGSDLADLRMHGARVDSALGH